jgi:hypothetical protein
MYLEQRWQPNCGTTDYALMQTIGEARSFDIRRERRTVPDRAFLHRSEIMLELQIW